MLAKDAQIFQKSKNYVKILGIRQVIRSRFQTEEPQILGATAQNVVGRPRFEHLLLVYINILH